MAPISGIGALNAFDLRKISAVTFGEKQQPERSAFIQNTIAPKYSLTFPKADNSVPGGDSPLGAKLPRLYA